MKNFKNLAFGLVAGALALGFSAFTNVSHSTVAEGDFYGSRAGSAPYQKLSNPYNSSLCEEDDKQCGYQVTAAGASTVTASSYSEAQLEAWATQAIPFVTRSSTLGIYSGN